MQTMNWLESHLESLDKVIETLNNDFCWNLEIVHGQEKIFVKSGESVIFISDSHAEINAFLYGMGLSVMGVPEELFIPLSKGMKEWCSDITGKESS
jgi:hypothetical protein